MKVAGPPKVGESRHPHQQNFDLLKRGNFILLVLACTIMILHAYYMPEGKDTVKKRPRFYKEPTSEDIETNGWTKANLIAIRRARIIGSRLMAATITVTTGTVLTVYELFTSSDIKLENLLPNFAIPAVVNVVAEIKVERQLFQIAHEVGELFLDNQNINVNEVDSSHTLNEP